MYLSQFSRLSSPKSRHQQIWCLIWTHFLVHGFPLCPLMAEGDKGPLWVCFCFCFFNQALIPSMRVCPHELMVSQKFHLQNPLYWWIKFKQMNIRGSLTFSLQHMRHLKQSHLQKQRIEWCLPRAGRREKKRIATQEYKIWVIPDE